MLFASISSVEVSGEEHIAVEVIEIRTGQSPSFNGKCEYFFDSLNLPFEKVRKVRFERDYSRSWYGMTGAIWQRFILSNKSESRSFILMIDQWEEVEIYIESEEGFSKMVTGTRTPVSERYEVLHRLLSIPIDIDIGDQKVLYLKMRTSNPFINYYSQVYDFLSKMELNEASRLRNKYTTNQMIIWFVMGLCFALIVYNGYLIYKVPRWDVLFLLLYIVVTSVFIANIHGITTIYFFPFFRAFELQLGLVLVHVSTILIGLYLIFYLRSGRRDIQTVSLIFMIAFMAISLCLSMINKQSMFYEARRVVEAIVITVVLGLAVYRKQHGAVYLVLAFVFVLIGKNISDWMAVKSYGSFLTGDIPYLAGFLFQMVIFSAGSSGRLIKAERDLKLAMTENQKILEAQNAELNKMVENRTRELEQANTKIVARNDALEDTVTQLQNTHKQLVANEKMVSIGKLTAGLAHELNNPLNFIHGSIRPLKKDLKDLKKHLPKKDEVQFLLKEMRQLLKGIDTGSERAIEVVQRLVEIDPKNERELEVNINIDELIGSLVDSYEKSYPGITFQREFSKELEMRCIPSEMHSLLNHLIRNAVEAVQSSEDPKILLSIESISSVIVVKLQDNGPGIPEELANQIFEPFFSTKEPGQGIGLGLFVSQTIVRKHGGTIKVSNNSDEGVTVIVELPQNLN